MSITNLTSQQYTPQQYNDNMLRFYERIPETKELLQSKAFSDLSDADKVKRLDSQMCQIARKIKNLDLENAGLTFVPSQVGVCCKLRRLNLEGNEITEMPDFTLPNLGLLNVQKNQITGQLSLGGYSKLEYLFADDNKIEEISEEGNLPELSKVTLNNNCIKVVPAFSGSNYLRFLGLINNPVREIGGFYLGKHSFVCLDLDKTAQLRVFMNQNLRIIAAATVGLVSLALTWGYYKYQ